MPKKKDDGEPPQFDMFPAYTRSRTDDPRTSKMAAESIMPTLNDKQRKVHEAFKGYPKGLTQWECEAKFGWHGATWRTRVSELGKMGLLVNVGEKYGKTRRIPQSHDPRAERDIWMCPEFIDPYWREPLPEPSPPVRPPLVTEERLPGKTNAYYDEEGRFIHDTCGIEGCTKKPGHSIGCSTLHGRLGMWYCEEHFEQLKQVDTP